MVQKWRKPKIKLYPDEAASVNVYTYLRSENTVGNLQAAEPKFDC